MWSRQVPEIVRGEPIFFAMLYAEGPTRRKARPLTAPAACSSPSHKRSGLPTTPRLRPLLSHCGAFYVSSFDMLLGEGQKPSQAKAPHGPGCPPRMRAGFYLSLGVTRRSLDAALRADAFHHLLKGEILKPRR